MQPVRIDRRQRPVAEARFDGAVRAPYCSRRVAQNVEAAGRHLEADFHREAVAVARRRQVGPGKKRQVGARMALGVGIEQVIGARIVLVDAALDQAHAEHAGVEVEVLLRRSRRSR